MLNLLYQFLIAALDTLFFAIFFKAPKRCLISCSIVAGTAWSIYYVISINKNFEYITAVFWGTLVGGILAEIFARIKKKPVTIFLIPAIIPLVPGAGMYYTMLYTIENNHKLMLSYGYQTLVTAGTIAVAIIVSSSIFGVWKHIKARMS